MLIFFSFLPVIIFILCLFAHLSHYCFVTNRKMWKFEHNQYSWSPPFLYKSLSKLNYNNILTGWLSFLLNIFASYFWNKVSDLFLKVGEKFGKMHMNRYTLFFFFCFLIIVRMCNGRKHLNIFVLYRTFNFFLSLF